MIKKPFFKKINRAEKSRFIFSYILLILFLTLSLVSVITIFLTGCTGSRFRKGEDRYPDYKGFINDYTATVSQDWLLRIEDLVQEVQVETSCEIAVAVIDTLEGATIEEYSAGLFEKWGIGKKDSDNGVLLLVAMEERQLRIEVGYGLESVITDIKAKNIIDDIIVPRFKSNDYSSGIYNGVVAISNLIYEDQGKNLLDYSDNLTSSTVTESESGDSPVFIVVIVILANFLPWAAIGLAFGIMALRHYIKTHRCPQCRRIALVINTKTLSYPSYISTGRASVEKYCRRCSFFKRSTISLPLLLKQTYSGSSSSSSSFSSFGGSSGSSHSSSSFGGGSSGGGGASGSW